MFDDNPLIVEEKVPVPEPSVVLVLNATVGFALVLHTTPRAVTVEPPSAVTLPPEAAPVPVMEVAVDVDTVGLANANVVNENSAP